MTGGMAGGIKNLDPVTGKIELVPALHGKVERRQAVRIRRGADNLGGVCFVQIAQSVDVVIVMMREHNMAEPPAPAFERCLDRPGFRRIGQEGLSGFAVMEEEGVIVR